MIAQFRHIEVQRGQVPDSQIGCQHRGRGWKQRIAAARDPARGVEALLARVKPRNATAWARQAAEAQAAWRREVAPLLASDASPIRPERLCAEVTRALPDDAILVSDTGYSAVWTGTLVDLPSPRHTYLRAAGSLGWSFPAALGAKCAAPDRPVVVFCGDGGFHYHLAELETAVRKSINVTVVVNDNAAFAQGRANIRRLYGNRPGDPLDINGFGKVDFAAIARGFGAEGLRVERAADIAPALRQALFGTLPSEVAATVFARIREQVRANIFGHGLGRHNREEMYSLAIDDITALSAFLGDKPYALGDQPTTLDATAYGFLAALLVPPIASPLKSS